MEKLLRAEGDNDCCNPRTRDWRAAKDYLSIKNGRCYRGEQFSESKV
jgi:hypothetical protein